MIHWQALVPIKQGRNGKSRLSRIFSQEERDILSLHMARHVLSELQGCDGLEDIAILSKSCPDWWTGSWMPDGGLGLNDELSGWRQTSGPGAILVIHADLPLLTAAGVRHLLDVADVEGIALATDRAGNGSNALAIADDRPFDFRFGPESRHLHATQSPGMTVIQSICLSLDIDTPEDLIVAGEHGFSWPHVLPSGRFGKESQSALSMQ